MISAAPTATSPMETPNDAGAELARRLSPEAVIRRDETLARRTTLRVGGPADW